MCDTLVATPSATAEHVMLFGKNSDREPNEAQSIIHLPAADHPPNSRVRCTYIEIPQAPHTHALMFSRPFWMWGGEMGVNEHGVVIGNEAVFTKDPVPPRGLLGMDLLRLGLERAATARQAVQVITDLIAEHGQGGNGGYMHPLYYHNSFIIADPAEAWVLETSGREWAALRVEGVYAISNGLTIHDHWDLASPGLVEHAIQQGWRRDARGFDFARDYSDPFYTRFSFCAHRRACTLQKLQEQSGALTVSHIAHILRSHGAADTRPYHPDRLFSTSEVCMHYGAGPWHAHQTTASLIVHLDPLAPVCFATGTAAPCTSLFKPVWVDTPLPEALPPGGKYNHSTTFWRHETLHRATLRDYPTLIERYRPKRDRLENDFFAAALMDMRHRPAAERARFVQDCFTRAEDAESRWLQDVLAHAPRYYTNPLYAQARQPIDQLAEIA
ncbi:MAG: C69 family dipeptidase [Anaerolineales bacterium]